VTPFVSGFVDELLKLAAPPQQAQTNWGAPPPPAPKPQTPGGVAPYKTVSTGAPMTRPLPQPSNGGGPTSAFREAMGVQKMESPQGAPKQPAWRPSPGYRPTPAAKPAAPPPTKAGGGQRTKPLTPGDRLKPFESAGSAVSRLSKENAYNSDLRAKQEKQKELANRPAGREERSSTGGTQYIPSEAPKIKSAKPPRQQPVVAPQGG
jgi:hypothetical protein